MTSGDYYKFPVNKLDFEKSSFKVDVFLFHAICSPFHNNNNNGYFKCYFSGEHIALSINKNNNGVNIELGKTNKLKALCMM